MEGETTITTWIIIGTIFIWIGWDVYLFATDKPTISDKITKWSKHALGISFAFGFVMGHWFW